NIHPRLTILTGANGAGKTTLLNIINRHFGWQTEMVGTPKQDKKTGALKFLSGIWNIITNKESLIPTFDIEVGEIIYRKGTSCKITIPEFVTTTYQLNFSNQQFIPGIHIPSHRPVYKYQKVSNISTELITKEQAYNKYNSSKVNRFAEG